MGKDGKHLPDKTTLQYLFACDGVANSPDGKPTFYGVFTSIRTTVLPCSHPYMVVAWGIRIAASCTAKLRLVSPDDQVVADFPEVPIDMKAGRLVGGWFEIRNIEFTQFGEYRVELMISDEVLADAPLVVEDLGKGNSDG